MQSLKKLENIVKFYSSLENPNPIIFILFTQDSYLL